MIIRNFAVRHGRQALANPVSRSWVGTLTTTPTTPPTAVPDSTAVAGLTPTEEETPAALTAAMAWARKKAEEKALKAEIAKIPRQVRIYQHIAKHTKPLGSKLQPRYNPNDLLANPPADATLEMLMAAQSHMGHNTSLWNPANARYIYGVRDGIHIISLETTAAHLRRAARVVEEVAYRAGIILFVGNRRGQKSLVVRAAKLAGACHLFNRWTPGSITNRDQILRSMPIKMLDELDREIPGYTEHIQERRPLLPDLVVCLNPIENRVLLYECGLANVPTIGIIDTNADPTWVTYQIPANDDSHRSVGLIAAVLGRAGQKGQARRRAEAATGHRTWDPKEEVEKFILKDAKQKRQAQEDAAGSRPKDDELGEAPNEELREILSLNTMMNAPH